MSLRTLLFKQEEGQREAATKAERRVQALATHDLVPWADQCLYAVGRSLSEWSKDAEGIERLYEAREGAQALQTIVEELVRRAERMEATAQR